MTSPPPFHLEQGITPQRQAQTNDSEYGDRILKGRETRALTPLRTAPTYSHKEIQHIAATERVTRLEDVILRRTLLPFEGLARRDVVEDVGGIVGETLDWPRPQIDAEIEACLQCLERRYRVDVGAHAIKDVEDAIPV
ncbi:MAG: glycerol-3-phosphate dehydrogenase C-terminal domain-containing protein [Pseudomonadota bacterium]|nr:glycerol-3-phosphate dehydrogenase C-terminal domain-containing protein [Pseudomonadota bacterium]